MSLYYTRMDQYIHVNPELSAMSPEQIDALAEAWKTGEGIEWQFNGRRADNSFTLKFGDIEIANLESAYMNEGMSSSYDAADSYVRDNYEFQDDVFQCTSETAATIGWELDTMFYGPHDDAKAHNQWQFCNSSHDIGVSLGTKMCESYDIMPNIHIYNDRFDDRGSYYEATAQTTRGYTFDFTFDKIGSDGEIELSYGNVDEFCAAVDAEMKHEYPMSPAIGDWLKKNAYAFVKEVEAVAQEKAYEMAELEKDKDRDER